MDPVQRNQAVFKKLDEEISLFIEGLSKASSQLDQLLLTSNPIGGGLQRDIIQLRKDLKEMVQDAMLIKHEVREL